MFNAKTEKIKYLAEKYPQRILELEKVFDKKFSNLVNINAKEIPCGTSKP